ncbi:ParB N-terminal domain-containing protein [Paucibacter sp. APW11]|uniref:ParB N-terminal domain-containing protein n=1 Tax=Roseateles aquae TaxID=3077235 RepID=A0ABU3PJ85_9BURK|nr:ParB N-terminal domain-containing protein [Paucibacter sp. APW11]MDT9002101.1 ParB N-terminal domain-containing protein [Paucibacter sp. APW11]
MSAPHSYEVSLRDTGFFLLSEEVIEADVEALAVRIAAAGRWTMPISVEARTGIIMDGNHRWHAARRLGLRQIPCYLLEYTDPRVRVYEWEHDEPFNLADIFSIANTRQVFPYKTTRHIFTPPLPPCDIGLAALGQRAAQAA